MIIQFEKTIRAKWKLKGESDTAKYNIQVSIKGRDRPLMTDVAPMIREIEAMDGKSLSEICGRSSLEAVAIHVRGIVQQHLEKAKSMDCDNDDCINAIVVKENDFFTAIAQ